MRNINNEAQKITANLFNRLFKSGWVKIPPGFKLVPIEPTPEQRLVGSNAHDTFEFCHCDAGLHNLSEVADAMYIAMVEAAPDASAVLNGKG